MQVGGAIGLAVLATLSTERTDKLLADGEGHAAALNSGYHLAYLIGAGLAAIAVADRGLRPAGAGAGAARMDGAGGRATQREPAYSELRRPNARISGSGSTDRRAAADRSRMQTTPSRSAQARRRPSPKRRTSAPGWAGSPAASGSSAALVAVAAAFLPGSDHAATPAGPRRSAPSSSLYGLASVTGWHPLGPRLDADAWRSAWSSTIPVVGLAIYLTGGSISYVEPLLVCPLLYAAFFFPARWAWPLSIELVARRRRAAALRRGRDRQRLPAALPRPRRRLPRRHLGDGRPQEAAGRRRGAPARHRQPRPADRGRQPARTSTPPCSGSWQRARPGRAAAAAPTASPLALLILDLDDFKGDQRPPRPPGRRRGPARGGRAGRVVLRSTDTAGPDRRRRVRGDRPRRPRRGRRGGMARGDPQRDRRRTSSDSRTPAPQRLGRLGRLPRRRRGLRDPDALRRRAHAAEQAPRRPPRRLRQLGGLIGRLRSADAPGEEAGQLARLAGRDLIALVLIVALQNSQEVSFDVLFASFQAPLIVVILLRPRSGP